LKNKPVHSGEWLAFARRFMADLPPRPGEASSHAEERQDAGLETQVLLAHVLAKPRAWVLAHPEEILTPQQQQELTILLAGLAGGTPLPYLTGHQEFFGLDFVVSPAVLIPRPETELLVERGLDWLRRHPTCRCAADVGTGSGCIAVSLAHQTTDLRILAVDRSWDALQVARQNARRHTAAGQVAFLQSDLLSAAAGPFDLVCANLPYIPDAALSALPVARHEPRLALDGGPDGLRAIRCLLAGAPRWLASGGLLLLEMQYDQGEAIVALANTYLPAADVTIHADLAGLPRVVEIEPG
jgi:release factor glutamine methyltransferase